jgi:hypothetical protein
MKFIFPQNYNFKNKILGVFDYTTAFVNIAWYAFVFLVVNLLFTSLNIKIFVFILFCFPLLLFSFSGFQGENMLLVFFYMSKFILKQKLYFYGKTYKH